MEKRTRTEVQAELDESYDTPYYRYRVTRHVPWRRWNVLFNILVPVVIGLVFQQSFSWMLGFIVIYFAIDFIIFAFRTGWWNHQVRKLGLEEFQKKYDPFYGTEQK